jgi:hypothetical protein
MCVWACGRVCVLGVWACVCVCWPLPLGVSAVAAAAAPAPSEAEVRRALKRAQEARVPWQEQHKSLLRALTAVIVAYLCWVLFIR